MIKISSIGMKIYSRPCIALTDVKNLVDGLALYARSAELFLSRNSSRKLKKNARSEVDRIVRMQLRRLSLSGVRIRDCVDPENW